MDGDAITIEVAGKPQGKGRARAFLMHGKVIHTTPPQTRSYESLIQGAAVDAMKSRERFEGPVSLSLIAIFDIPTSYSQKKKNEAMCGVIKPTKKPDLDNVYKAWADGMNSVVFKDDVQIVSCEMTKKYGPQAKVVAIVRPL
jgi:Holliday junction resolvase RusA-like endonuclease